MRAAMLQQQRFERKIKLWAQKDEDSNAGADVKRGRTSETETHGGKRQHHVSADTANVSSEPTFAHSRAGSNSIDHISDDDSALLDENLTSERRRPRYTGGALPQGDPSTATNPHGHTDPSSNPWKDCVKPLPSLSRQGREGSPTPPQVKPVAPPLLKGRKRKSCFGCKHIKCTCSGAKQAARKDEEAVLKAQKRAGLFKESPQEVVKVQRRNSSGQWASCHVVGTSSPAGGAGSSAGGASNPVTSNHAGGWRQTSWGKAQRGEESDESMDEALLKERRNARQKPRCWASKDASAVPSTTRPSASQPKSGGVVQEQSRVGPRLCAEAATEESPARSGKALECYEKAMDILRNAAAAKRAAKQEVENGEEEGQEEEEEEEGKEEESDEEKEDVSMLLQSLSSNSALSSSTSPSPRVRHFPGDSETTGHCADESETTKDALLSHCGLDAAARKLGAMPTTEEGAAFGGVEQGAACFAEALLGGNVRNGAAHTQLDDDTLAGSTAEIDSPSALFWMNPHFLNAKPAWWVTLVQRLRASSSARSAGSWPGFSSSASFGFSYVCPTQEVHQEVNECPCPEERRRVSMELGLYDDEAALWCWEPMSDAHVRLAFEAGSATQLFTPLYVFGGDRHSARRPAAACVSSAQLEKQPQPQASADVVLTHKHNDSFAQDQTRPKKQTQTHVLDNKPQQQHPAHAYATVMLAHKDESPMPMAEQGLRAASGFPRNHTYTHAPSPLQGSTPPVSQAETLPVLSYSSLLQMGMSERKPEVTKARLNQTDIMESFKTIDAGVADGMQVVGSGQGTQPYSRQTVTRARHCDHVVPAEMRETEADWNDAQNQAGTKARKHDIFADEMEEAEADSNETKKYTKLRSMRRWKEEEELQLSNAMSKFGHLNQPGKKNAAVTFWKEIVLEMGTDRSVQQLQKKWSYMTKISSR